MSVTIFDVDLKSKLLPKIAGVIPFLIHDGLPADNRFEDRIHRCAGDRSEIFLGIRGFRRGK